MLDVHPPEHTPHSWRDFLTHIATIVVGLLIAIALEQGVEWMHHRHQIEVARERIHEEMRVNERIIDDNKVHLAEMVTRLDTNMTILRAAEIHKPLPGKELDYSWNLQGSYDAAYQSAHNGGVLNLLPYDEVAMYADCYKFNEENFHNLMKLLDQLNVARAAMRSHTVEQLSPDEVQALLTATSTVREQALYARTLGNLERREWEAALSGGYRNDFSGSAK